MPLFDLECQKCQHRWEDMVRDGAIPPCPECAATDVNKLPTVGGLYEADFKPEAGQSVELMTSPMSKGFRLDGVKMGPPPGKKR